MKKAASFIYIPGMFWWGYATWLLWGWFVVPLGVIEISYFHALGLGLVAGMFVGTSFVKRNMEPETQIATMLLGPPLMIGMGALFHLGL